MYRNIIPIFLKIKRICTREERTRKMYIKMLVEIISGR